MLNLTPVTEQHVLDNPDKQFIAVWKYDIDLQTCVVASKNDTMHYFNVDEDVWSPAWWSVPVTFYGEAE